MRQITDKAIENFKMGNNFTLGNTSVRVVEFGVVELYLHGNLIARQTVENSKRRLFITNAGWATNTTKERLNGLPGVNIFQKRGQWYLNGKEWDGSMIEVDLTPAA